MNQRFRFRDDLSYPDLESHTSENGSRVYYTPFGPAPSVTTILATLPNPGLDEWRERVGEEEAARVSKEATTIGSCMHNQLEAYVKGEAYKISKHEEAEAIAVQMFQAVKMLGLRRLTEVWGIEVALYYENLYAGRTDLVGLYDGLPSIIDYKTAKYFKKDEWLGSYLKQLSAYSLAHDELFPQEEIQQAVLLLGTRPNPEYRVPPKCQIVVVSKADLERYKDEWIEVLEGYHAER